MVCGNCTAPCVEISDERVRGKVIEPFVCFFRDNQFAGSISTILTSLEEKVLTNPDYCRETIERLLQLELELNGVEGLGYNDRYRKLTKDEKEERLHDIVKYAIFGKRAYQYSEEYQMFLDTGIMPTAVPLHYRKKLT